MRRKQYSVEEVAATPAKTTNRDTNTNSRSNLLPNVKTETLQIQQCNNRHENSLNRTNQLENSWLSVSKKIGGYSSISGKRKSPSFRSEDDTTSSKVCLRESGEASLFDDVSGRQTDERSRLRARWCSLRRPPVTSFSPNTTKTNSSSCSSRGGRARLLSMCDTILSLGPPATGSPPLRAL